MRRLGTIAEELGLYEDPEREILEAKLDEERRIQDFAGKVSITPAQAEPVLARAKTAPIAHSVKVLELTRRHGVSLADLLTAAGHAIDFSPDSLVSADLEIKYSGYFERERAQAERLRLMGDFALPADFPYADTRSLSHEARQKLSAVKPLTLAQASRIPGVSPSDIQNLVIEVEKRRSRSLAH